MGAFATLPPGTVPPLLLHRTHLIFTLRTFFVLCVPLSAASASVFVKKVETQSECWKRQFNNRVQDTKLIPKYKTHRLEQKITHFVTHRNIIGNLIKCHVHVPVTSSAKSSLGSPSIKMWIMYVGVTGIPNKFLQCPPTNFCNTQKLWSWGGSTV